MPTCHPVTKASARQARWRARQRAGVTVVSVGVSLDAIEALIGVEFLQRHESEDKLEIAVAVEHWLAELVSTRRHFV